MRARTVAMFFDSVARMSLVRRRGFSIATAVENRLEMSTSSATASRQIVSSRVFAARASIRNKEFRLMPAAFATSVRVKPAFVLIAATRDETTSRAARRSVGSKEGTYQFELHISYLSTAHACPIPRCDTPTRTRSLRL
jgi:hypothetical protein